MGGEFDASNTVAAVAGAVFAVVSAFNAYYARKHKEATDDSAFYASRMSTEILALKDWINDNFIRRGECANVKKPGD